MEDYQSVYCYPGTHVLRNRLAIEPRSTSVADQQDALRRLAVEERRWSAVGLMALRAAPVKGEFDLVHLSHIHRTLVGQVYEWAGAPRVENISKNGSTFGAHQFIPAYVGQLRDGLQREDYLRGSSTREEFCDRAAHYLSRLNYVHPFREGNGRTTREFVRELGLKAGYEISWRDLDARRWNAAFVAAFPDESNTFGPSAAISVELERCVLNPVPDKRLQEAYEAETPRPADPPWRGTLAEAVLEAAQRSPGPVAFVSGHWQHHNTVRVQDPQDVLNMLDAAEAHWPADLDRSSGPVSAVFTVTDAGHIRNTVTGQDEYLRVVPGSRTTPAPLAAAVEAHFREREGLRRPDVEEPTPSIDV